MSDSRDNSIGFSSDVFLGNTSNNYLVEVTRGSGSVLSDFAVGLEPCFARFDPGIIYVRGKEEICQKQVSVKNWQVKGFRFGRRDPIDWELVERWLVSLCGCRLPCSFEVAASGDGVSFFVGSSSRHQLDMLEDNLLAFFSDVVVFGADDFLSGVEGDVTFCDLFLKEPYYRRLNECQSVVSNFVNVACRDLREGELVCLQVLFVPVRCDWQFNIKSLVLAEKMLRERVPFGKTSGSMIKAADKPLFAARIRLGTVNARHSVAGRVRRFAGSILQAGASVGFFTEHDYEKSGFDNGALLDMLKRRFSCASGIILSSDELASFVHLPCNVRVDAGVKYVKGFGVPDVLVGSGRPLGTADFGKELGICLPDGFHNKCVYQIGASRKGKSSSMESQAVFLAGRGDCCGVGYLDPHRKSAYRLLGLLPESCVERVVWLDYDDPDFVVDFNPFDESDESCFGRLSVEYANSFRHLFDAGSYHRMNHFLGMAIYALFVLKKNLASVPLLFSRSGDGERLRKQVVARTSNVEVGRFWKSEFYSYGKDAFSPLLNRFSALFMDLRASMIFSCEESKVNIQGLMDDGMIIVEALPSSVDVCSLAGGMNVAQFQKGALSRSLRPGDGKPFFLFVDEFHRFSSGRIIESIINETVKYGLHVCLAHQETGQLSDELLRAVLSIPNIMVFNVNMLDAKKIAPVFNGKVGVDDILNLKVGEVFARLDGSVVNFRCPKPKDAVNESLRQRIIEESRKKYYSPVKKTKKLHEDKPKQRVFDTL